MNYVRSAQIAILVLAANLVGAQASRGQEKSPHDSQPSQGASVLRVGGAYADITPVSKLPNYNDSPIKPSEDGSSSLKAHIVICSVGESKAAIISVDCTFLGRAEVLRIRDELRWRVDIDPDYISIAATHSHATPATAASFLSGALPDPLYLDFMIERICRAAEEAGSRLEPARLVAETLPAPPIGVPRRRVSPEGQVYMAGVAPDSSYPPENPIDKEMPYIVFENLDGRPLAVIFALACHNNMARGGYSGDMFGRAGEILREKLGEQVVTLALAAPCGDVGYVEPGSGRTFPDDRAAGRAIAEAILKSYPQAKRRDCGKLVMQSVVKRIPDRPYDPAEFVYDGGRGSSESAVEFHQKRYGPEEIAVRERGQTYCNVEIQVIAFGSVALVTNPAELFSVYGLKIREASPFEVTLASSLTNGYCGYVPTPKSFEHRGYETYRTVYTSRLVKDAGERILRDSVHLLRQAHGEYGHN